jgi:HK97 family phage portal protein
MKLFGFNITREEKGLSQVPDSNRGWISLIRESFPGAWQRNIEIDRNLVTSHFAVFACMTLIAGDIAKLGAPNFKRLKKEVWEVSTSSAYDPVLREPNQFQTPNQFWENWVLSKLTHGNTYALKGRDNRGVVSRLWVLDPNNVQVLVSDNDGRPGDVFYNLRQDNLPGIGSKDIPVPASEIIHDRMNPIFHPLVGLSPIYAAGLLATIGLNIFNSSANLFGNSSIPSGIITTPHQIPRDTAQRLHEEWTSRYGPSGSNRGGTAILGDGLEFKPMSWDANQTQMLEQLKATAEWVCSCFHVPPYKIGLAAPSYANVEALNIEYYAQAIQKQLEDIESCLIRGLEMKPGTKVEFDIEGLLRMDTATQTTAIQQAIGAGVMAPNEARAKMDLPPVAGGESPYLQQQNFSLEALAKRDTKEDPFGLDKPEPAPFVEGPPKEEPPKEEEKHQITAADILLASKRYRVRHAVSQS